MASRSLNVVISGDTKGLQKALGDAEKRTSKFGDNVKAAGAVAAAGFAVFGKKAIDTASDISESIAKNQQLFGKHAQDIDAWSKTTAESMGVSRAAALEATGTFGNLFSALKIGPKESAEMSKALVGLAGDLASFNNASPEEAMEAIRSGLVGETEPLRKFGVNINDAALRTEALRQGLVKTTKEALTPQEKALAAQGLMFKQTEKAQGDFARTSEGLANKQRVLKAEFSDVAGKLGETLVPILAKVAGAMTDVVGWTERHKTATKAIAAVVVGAAVAFGAYSIATKAMAVATGIATAATKAFNLALKMNPIGLVVTGLVALGAGLVLAYKKSETFRSIVDGAWKGIRDTTKAVLDWLVPKVKVAFGVVADVVGVAVKVVKGYINAYVTAAKGIATGIVAAFNFLKALPGKIAGFLSDSVAKIREWASNFTDAAKAVAGKILAGFGKVGDLAGKVGGWLKDGVAKIGTWERRGAEAAANLGKKIVSGVLSGLGDLGHKIYDRLKDSLEWAGSQLEKAGGFVFNIAKKVTGDGIGIPSVANFGGGLMGARPSMAPFAAAASRFGLGVSSGKFGREGKLTSSGNVSYHSTGEAIDVAGNPAGMLGFFRQMKSKYGARLAELIYTPGGQGVKNGAAYTYGGKVAADHFDHVHVAFDSGTPGVGDGVGRVARTGDGVGNWRNGPKPPMTHAAVAALAEGVGLPGETFAQLARGESGYDPDNVGHDPGGSTGLGLWQITTKFNDDIIAKYGGPRAMFDPKKNALAARDIWRRQGKSAWYGTGFVTGWDLHYKGASPGGSSKGKSAAPAKGTNTSGFAGGGTASGGKYDPVAMYADDTATDAPVLSPRMGVSDFLNRIKPVKGRGPTKGFPSGYTPPEPVDKPAGPSEYISPFAAELRQLGASGALAALTADTGDDVAVAQRVQDIRGGELDLAKQSGDPGRIQEAAEAFRTAIDALSSLKNTVDTEAQARQAFTDALKGVQDELKRTNDIADRAQASSGFQAEKYLADLLSGRIARGVVGRAFTPGSGVEYVY